MLTQEMVTVLLIALAVNAAIVIAMLAAPAVRRRTRRAMEAGIGPDAWGHGGPVAREWPSETEDGLESAAGEPWFLAPSGAEAAHGERPWALNGATDSAVGPEPAPPAVSLPPMSTPDEWASALDDEAARVARYHRPATIALVELAGLDRLAERVGRAAAERLVPPIATTIHRHARASDRLAYLDEARFGILLIETDEVNAINFVERIRSQCDVWLAAGAVTLRLSVGWAEIRSGGREAAVREAEDRLFADRRRTEPPGLPAAPSVGRDRLASAYQATGS